MKLVRALFGTRMNAAITLAMLALFAWLLPPLWNWAVGDAVWTAVNRAGCTTGGACWAFIRARFALFFYGPYPVPERWRVDLAMAIVVLACLGMITARRHHGRWALLLAIGVPAACGVLLCGGVFGLPWVDTASWGGLMLNVVITYVALGGALPIGIALAFGRRSRYPAVRFGSTAMIEFWRGVPLLAVLFMGLILLPLFLPHGVTIDNLVRAMVVLTLFESAYMAETIRGGLQGVAPGQEDAALALGMHGGQVQILVVLPQALRLCIPGIVNIAIDLFKDTTLVSIVGLFDLMGVVTQSMRDTAWLGLAAEGYTFAALVFFLACLVLSLGGSLLEHRFGQDSLRR